MKSLIRLAILAGAAYLLTRYFERGRGALLTSRVRERSPQRTTHHDALQDNAQAAQSAAEHQAQREDQREARREAQHEALAPLGGLRATAAGHTPLPVAPELHTS